jgi:hypothetical protein
VAAFGGLLVTHRLSGFEGVVTRVGNGAVELTADGGAVRVFRLERGAFLCGGRAVTLVPSGGPRGRDPASPAPLRTARTASGSVAVRHDARVARGGRLLVEGVHDAELLEKVWGDDLRHEGVVVERLDGVDHLPAWVAEFRPAAGRRLGVLVDHLVPGSKEARIAALVRHPHVLVLGTPFVDVWEAVRPHVLGMERWPRIPRGTPWKGGIAAALGDGDVASLWRRILGSVRTYADLDPRLVGAVEQLIDFVTETA